MKLFFVVFLILTIASIAFGSENCGMMGGICREVCNQDEEILEGAFIDCGDKQECCVYRSPSKERSEDGGKDGQWKKPAE